MKLIAVFVIVVAVGSLSAEPGLLNGLLNGVTGTVKAVTDVVVDVVKGLSALLNGLLSSVTKITGPLPFILGPSAPNLNKLSVALSRAFSTLSDTVNKLDDTITNIKNVGSDLKNVEFAVVDLVQLVNIDIAMAPHLPGNCSLICSIDHAGLDLGVAVDHLLHSVINAISEITGPITKAVRKVLCSLLMLLKTVLAIVDDVLSNLSALLARRGLPKSKVLSRIASQLSKTLSGVRRIVGKCYGKCVISELVSSLNKIVGPFSDTVQSLIGTLDPVAGSLTTALIGLSSKLKDLTADDVADITADVYEELIDALKGVFDRIKNAVSAVSGEEKAVVGLVDVSVSNVLTAITIVVQAIGSITYPNLQQCGGENGIDKHLTVANFQLVATVQTLVDAIIYLAKQTQLCAAVANVLERIVAAVVAAVIAVIDPVETLVRALISTDDVKSNVNKILIVALRSITSSFKGSSEVLSASLSELSAAVDGGIDCTRDVSAGTLRGLKGLSVSGALCGTMSGITSALGCLTQSISGGANEVAVPVEHSGGSLKDLIDRLKSTQNLSEVESQVSDILDTLEAVSSSLNVVNGSGSGDNHS